MRKVVVQNKLLGPIEVPGCDTCGTPLHLGNLSDCKPRIPWVHVDVCDCCLDVAHREELNRRCGL